MINGLISTLQLLGSLGIFLYGMKLMSESLQKVAGNKMRSILSTMTSNRVMGVFTGFFITAIIQSSSATTVMIVSFANAGLLALSQAIGVIMGANIGTTVTAWLISILGFKVKMSALAIPLIGLGFPLLFSKHTRRKSWGELIIGFSLIFIGLDFLKAAVPDIKEQPQMFEFLSSFTEWGYGSYFLFIIIGTLLTVAIQSSSATMAFTLVLCFNGLIPYEMAAAMVLGENIGTTITANLAALITNTTAKRAARAHFIFNSFGVLWVLLIFPYFLDFIDYLMVSMGGPNASPKIEATAIPVALSVFHTSFNIINVFIQISFIKSIEKIAVRMVPEQDNDEEFRLQHIKIGLVSTSELSLVQAKKEIVVFAQRVQKMFGFVEQAFGKVKPKAYAKLMKKTHKYEDIADSMELEIANYLTKLTEGELGKVASRRVRSMLELISDIESIADLCYGLSQTIDRQKENKVTFTDDMRKNIEEMFSLVKNAFEVMISNLDNDFDKVELIPAINAENAINDKRNELKAVNIENINNGLYEYKTGIIFNDILMQSERIGDYIINVTEAMSFANEYVN